MSQQLFAHTAGQTFCAFSDDGKTLLTVGDDCHMNVFNVFGSGELVSAERPVELDVALFAIAVKGDRVAVGDDNAAVDLLSVATGKRRQSLLRCTLAVRHLQFHPNGQDLFVAADDRSLKLVRGVDSAADCQILDFPTPPKSVISFSLNPTGSLMAAVSCDGSLLIYNTEERKLIHTSSNLIAPMEPETSIFAVAWDPTDNFIAVPVGKDIRIMNAKNGWAEAFKLSGHKGNVELAAWSPNGRYLVSSGGDQQLILWDIVERIQVRAESVEYKVNDVKWNPKLNSIVFTFANGFISWSNQWVPEGRASPLAISTKGSSIAAESSKFVEDSAAVSDMEEDIKAKADPTSEEDDDENDLMSMEDGEDESDLENFVTDDIDHVYSRKPRQPLLPLVQPLKLAEPQEAFQPTATPERSGRRYLAFNMVGVIVSIDHNLHHTVDIEFHDITSHRAIHFKDHFGFSMAALGENGAVFSVPVKKDSIDGKIIAPSPVHYRPFETWGGSNEWTVYLPAEESALALAVSDKWISVATDQNYVRIFGKSGIQSYIFSIPSGSIVSMTAFEETLFLIYNSSTEQGSRLEYELFDLETKRSLMSVAPLPVSSKSKLEWVGFSETGIPLTYDSVGVIRGCMIYDNFRWIPLLDTKPLTRGKQDHYWPTGATDEAINFVLCKAGEKYPGFPRPIISDVKIAMPVASADTPVGQWEQDVLYNMMLYRFYRDESVANGEDQPDENITREGAIDKALLKLFAQACKSGRSGRALDLAFMLFRQNSVRAAYQIAGRANMPQLGDKIELIRQSKFAAAAQQDFSGSPLPINKSTADRLTAMHSPIKSKPDALRPSTMISVNESSLGSASTINYARNDEDVLISAEAPLATMPINPFKKKTVRPIEPTPKNVFQAIQQHEDRKIEAKRQLSSKAFEDDSSKKRKVTQQSMLAFLQKSKSVNDENAEVNHVVDCQVDKEQDEVISESKNDNTVELEEAC